jgi:hypothetical protein
LNISDIPELMPGAMPSANSVERERFNQRCISLWKNTQDENGQRSEAQAVCEPQCQDAAEHNSQLEKMVPNLDRELVWNICQETPNMQDAIDTLLALSAAMSTDVAGSTGTANHAGINASTSTMSVSIANQLEIDQKDDGTWPALVGNDGWEAVSYQALQQLEQELGSAWCNTVKDAAALPAPKQTPGILVKAKCKQKESQDAVLVMDCLQEDTVFTDYELRHVRGQMRAKKFINKAALCRTTQACIDHVQRSEQAVHVCDSEDSYDSLHSESEGSLS